MAVGGGRGRLIRQLLTESLLLSGIGATLGVRFAEWGARLLVRFLGASSRSPVDVRVLAFTVSVAVLTGLLFGIAPAWQGTRVQPYAAMKASARGVIEGAKLGLGKVLVTAQVALSLLVVVGAGLMLSTFWKLISLDAGFDRDRVLLVSADLRSGNYPRERWSAVYQEMLDQLRAIPGVHSASVSSITPVCHCRWTGEVEVDGYTPKSRSDAMAAFNNVSDGYFETLGSSVVMGRDFNSHDTSTSLKAAIVSTSFAQKYFGAGESTRATFPHPRRPWTAIRLEHHGRSGRDSWRREGTRSTVRCGRSHRRSSLSPGARADFLARSRALNCDLRMVRRPRSFRR